MWKINLCLYFYQCTPNMYATGIIARIAIVTAMLPRSNNSSVSFSEGMVFLVVQVKIGTETGGPVLCLV